MAEKVSWNELVIDECFLGPGGMYKKVSEDTVFYYNGHTEMPVDNEAAKTNKVFERIES